MPIPLHLNMHSEESVMLVEKFKPHNYVEDNGVKVWVNKYGDIIKRQTKDGIFFIQYKTGTTYSENVRDLSSYYGVIAEEELIAHMSEEIAKEIDREIMKELLKTMRIG